MNRHSVTFRKYSTNQCQEIGWYRVERMKGKFNKCPVTHCTGGGKEKFGMYRHFYYRHPKADILVEEDGILPKCEWCGMRTARLQKHMESDTCKRARGRRTNEIQRSLQDKAEMVSFQANGKTLEKVRRFRYLGRIISDDDDDTECINAQLKSARQRWNCIARILKREGANSKCMAKFYLTVVQAVLLYGADTWVVSKRNMGKLRSFHLRAIRHMTGQHIRKIEKGWEYPNHEELMKKCKLFDIEVYIERRRGTLRKYLEENRKELLEKAQGIGRHCRNVNKIFWWNQKYVEKKEMDEMQKNMWLK